MLLVPRTDRDEYNGMQCKYRLSAHACRQCTVVCACANNNFVTFGGALLDLFLRVVLRRVVLHNPPHQCLRDTMLVGQWGNVERYFNSFGGNE